MGSPNSPVLKRLHSLNTSSSEFHSRLSDFLHGEEYRQCVPNLQGGDPAWLVDYLDKAFDGLDPSSPASRKCLCELRNICGTKAIFPSSHKLPSHLSIGSGAIVSGSNSDVCEGSLGGLKVCVKRVRTHALDSLQTTPEAFYREVAIWKKLTHPKILPFLGATINPLQIVSNWMPGETLPKYIKKNPNADRLGLLSDIADGLCYLHSRDVIHGDLKGPNVLVDADGHAQIMDFRLATVAVDVNPEQSPSNQRIGSERWSAPEVLEDGTTSKKIDIFSFAMVVIEAFSGTTPFGDMQPIMAVLAITQGRRPPRPAHPGVTGKLWKVIQRCWDDNPQSRPEAPEVLQALRDSNPPPWKRLISPKVSTNERIELIKSLFCDRDEVEVFEYLSGNDAQAFADVIDEVLEKLDSLPPGTRRECLRSSYKICGREALLPKSLLIPLCYDPLDTPQTCGGLADVWKGEYKGREVAAKALRVYKTSDPKGTRKWFCKEVVMWNTLRHPNVLPLLGVTMSEDPLRFVMVSAWMENGNIIQFLKREDVDRLKLLEDATEGLVYMHDQRIVHGDLKGANIMINETGRAVLADFGLVTLIPDQSTFLSTCLEGGTVQWMSPELLDPEQFSLPNKRPTMQSDCYALGMVIYEVLSGQVPFSTYSPFTALRKVLDGERPERPQGEAGRRFTDGIWSVMELCWKAKPNERASAKDVLVGLEGKS